MPSSDPIVASGHLVDSIKVTVAGNANVDRQVIAIASDADATGSSLVAKVTSLGLLCVDGSLASQPVKGTLGATPVYVQSVGYGLGGMVACPNGSINGTPLDIPPDGTLGVRIYVPTGASLNYTIQPAQPTSSPPSYNLAGPAIIDENMIAGQALYVIASTGSPSFRYM